MVTTATPATDEWRHNDHPVEEWTTGAEVGPAVTEWGHHVRISLKTSRRSSAGTTGEVFITFYGVRATSDKMLLQKGFAAGGTDVISLTLAREVGALQRVRLENNSTDGWLLASLWIDIGPSTYYFESTDIFLDTPDSALSSKTWDGGHEGQNFRGDVGTIIRASHQPSARSICLHESAPLLQHFDVQAPAL